jgi:DeoR/GlpR family transcriptional regulator of sugar metabolism
VRQTGADHHQLLPLANYLIDQEHDSVVIMGGQYNRASPSP